MNLPRLDNRVAFVAGASRGIGRDISKALAGAGAQVAVAARTEEPGKLAGTIYSVADAITASGGTALPVVCDVTDEASVQGAVDRVNAELGPIDILVANAGALWLGSTLDTPLKRWELCLRVNLTGTFLVTRAVLPSVMEHKRGSLIAITTTGVFQTELGSNAYWVSKAGIERYYAGLATELAPYDVAVNCLAPRKVVMTEGAVAGGIDVPADMIEEPAAIGAAAVYLAGQTARTLTGTVQYSLDLLEEIGHRVAATRRDVFAVGSARPGPNILAAATRKQYVCVDAPNKEGKVMKPIRIGGENVFPDEVEAVLCYHPSIAAAAVIGMPDGRAGEVLVALVAPKPGQTAPSAEEVRQFCIGRLTGFKVPHDVLSVDAIQREGRRADYEWARTTATALLTTPTAP